MLNVPDTTLKLLHLKKVFNVAVWSEVRFISKSKPLGLEALTRPTPHSPTSVRFLELPTTEIFPVVDVIQAEFPPGEVEDVPGIVPTVPE
jgi:hypothetical protein